MLSRQIASKLRGYETPFYLYDMALLRQTLESVVYESKKYGYKVHYAIKANYDDHLLAVIREYGLGIDCASGNELRKAVEAGFDPKGIVYAGVGKRDKELKYAIEQNILAINCESIQELELVDALSAEAGKVTDIALRINPDIDPKTNHCIDTGQADSKFGISYEEVLEHAAEIRSLKNVNIIGLHLHIGSQIRELHVFENMCNKVNVIVENLEKLGCKFRFVDVGGGLGVDYEGTRSQSDCSVNYGLNEYANNIIWAIGDACEENGLPHPTVITESGRAVTAHHTVLVSNIIGVERSETTEATPPADDAPRSLQSMWETWQEMHEPGTRRSLREWLHDSQMDLHDIHIGYSSGTFSLQERAWAEQLYLSMCHEVQKQLDPQNRAHRPIIDELQERMADKMYVNFSLFQSMPDAWGIDQLFPVLPLEGLDQVPERRAVLLDITCDSDGAIDHYIDGDGIATTMPMPEYDPENPPMLGFFMVGAYQEILGNMHNLFGDTEAVDVFVFPDGSVEVELSDEGDTVADMLQYVQLDPKTLLTQFRDQVKKTDLDAELQQQFLEEFEAGLYGYTYLEDE